MLPSFPTVERPRRICFTEIVVSRETIIDGPSLVIFESRLADPTERDKNLGRDRGMDETTHPLPEEALCSQAF